MIKIYLQLINLEEIWAIFFLFFRTMLAHGEISTNLVTLDATDRPLDVSPVAF
jgi:hypothetical protein